MRALYTSPASQRVFAVQGARLYEILANNTVLERGNLISAAGPVQMADNTLDLMVVDGIARYGLDLASNAFTVLTDGIVAASRVGFLDNRFVVVRTNTNEFYWSDLASTTIDPLSFATAEGETDLLQSLIVAHRELWLFGSQSTEVFYDAGDVDQPFQRVSSLFIHQGCLAPQSPARVGEVICWLSRNDQGRAMVLMAAGQQVQRISTYAVEQAIYSYTGPETALGWGQQQDGHTWYFLTFPFANKTWVYDVTTQLWHERGYRNPATGIIGRHRANCYAYAFEQHLVGDFEHGDVYELDPFCYDDDGEALVFEAVFPPLYDGETGALVQQNWLLLECETGTGLDGAPPLGVGVDPQVALFCSDNGGHTYPPALQRSLGPIGQNKHIVEWRALGSSYDRRNKISISDPVKIAITAVLTDVKPLLR